MAKLLGNLTLTPYETADADSLFQLTVKNKAWLRDWLDWVDNVKTSGDTLAFLEQQIAGDLLGYIIRYDETMVGTVGVVQVDEMESSAEIGYWIDKEMQGKGIVTWAVRKLVSDLVKKNKLKSVLITCVGHNYGSQRVATKCGFEYAGIRRDGIVLNGMKHDLLVYQLSLKKDKH